MSVDMIREDKEKRMLGQVSYLAAFINGWALMPDELVVVVEGPHEGESRLVKGVYQRQSFLREDPSGTIVELVGLEGIYFWASQLRATPN